MRGKVHYDDKLVLDDQFNGQPIQNVIKHSAKRNVEFRPLTDVPPVYFNKKVHIPINPNDIIRDNVQNYWNEVQFNNEHLPPQEYASNGTELIRKELGKGIRKIVEEMSEKPDQYNIPRDIKVAGLLPINELIVISKSLREYMLYLNYRFVPPSQRLAAYPRCIPQTWLTLQDTGRTDSHGNPVGIGVFLNIPNDEYFVAEVKNSHGNYVKAPRKFIPAGTYICTYEGVCLSEKEYANIYDTQHHENGIYTLGVDMNVQYNDGLNVIRNAYYKTVYIDGGKYGNFATRMNHACRFCANAECIQMYVPISLDTYRCTMYIRATRDIYQGQEICWDYGANYPNVECSGIDGQGCCHPNPDPNAAVAFDPKVNQIKYIKGIDTKRAIHLIKVPEHPIWRTWNHRNKPVKFKFKKVGKAWRAIYPHKYSAPDVNKYYDSITKQIKNIVIPPAFYGVPELPQ